MNPETSPPSEIVIHEHIPVERKGEYFTIPFTVPAGMESFTLTYEYNRRETVAEGDFRLRQRLNTVDLGLLAPDGSQVGASGSDKSEVTISEVASTPGYRAVPLTPGVWHILVGAYRIHPSGAEVTWRVRFQPKRRRLLRGELHAHTLASDGVHSADELAAKALRAGLDFLVYTDHNQMVSPAALPHLPGLTCIPGVEWTHYRGHANFSGLAQPYDGSFAVNTFPEVQRIFQTAHDRGALITLNHPFDRECGFAWDMEQLPWHCLEIWNGPMREENIWAVALWQSLLSQGRRIAAVGGSDYHRDTPFLFLGGPTQCVWADSAGQSDILAALRAGRGYTIFSPEGPILAMRLGDAWAGDTLPFTGADDLHIVLSGLEKGDVIRAVTRSGAVDLAEAPSAGEYETLWRVPEPGFVRVEVQRAFLPGLPKLAALLSNPIYLDA